MLAAEVALKKIFEDKQKELTNQIDLRMNQLSAKDSKIGLLEEELENAKRTLATKGNVDFVQSDQGVFSGVVKYLYDMVAKTWDLLNFLVRQNFGFQ